MEANFPPPFPIVLEENREDETACWGFEPEELLSLKPGLIYALAPSPRGLAAMLSFNTVESRRIA